MNSTEKTRITTHEFAQLLRAAADFIESRPSVQLPRNENILSIRWHFFEKQEFLNVARAMGGGNKEIDKIGVPEFVFLPHAPSGVRLRLSIYRDSICEKVQEERWECKALLSPEEEQSIGGAA